MKLLLVEIAFIQGNIKVGLDFGSISSNRSILAMIA